MTPRALINPLQCSTQHRPMSREDFYSQLERTVAEVQSRGVSLDDLLSLIKNSVGEFEFGQANLARTKSYSNATIDSQKRSILDFLATNGRTYVSAQDVAQWGAKHPELGKSMRHRSYVAQLLLNLKEEGKIAGIRDGKSVLFAPIEVAVADALKNSEVNASITTVAEYLDVKAVRVAETATYKFWASLNK